MNKVLCELRIVDVQYSKQHPMIYYHLWEIDKNGELIHKSKIEFADNVNDLIKEFPPYKNGYKNNQLYTTHQLAVGVFPTDIIEKFFLELAMILRYYGENILKYSINTFFDEEGNPDLKKLFKKAGAKVIKHFNKLQKEHDYKI